MVALFVYVFYTAFNRKFIMKFNNLIELLGVANVREITELFPCPDEPVEMPEGVETLWEFLEPVDYLTRLPALIEGWHLGLARERDWLKVLGDQWIKCDNPSRYIDDLRLTTPFGLVADGKIPNSVMMSLAEQRCLSLLPDEFRIFRGCYRSNRAGVSWSLHKDAARNFPYLHRFYRPEETPLLVEAVVQKRDVIALKLDRDEAEVITLRPEVVSVTDLLRSL